MAQYVFSTAALGIIWYSIRLFFCSSRHFTDVLQQHLVSIISKVPKHDWRWVKPTFLVVSYCDCDNLHQWVSDMSSDIYKRPVRFSQRSCVCVWILRMAVNGGLNMICFQTTNTSCEKLIIFTSSMRENNGKKIMEFSEGVSVHYVLSRRVTDNATPRLCGSIRRQNIDCSGCVNTTLQTWVYN